VQTNIEKAATIAEFHTLKYEHSGAILIKLLNILINELRIENDTVNKDNLDRNQGKIDAYVGLKFYLERELPSTPVKNTA
jgi:hypothetical protein